MAAFLFYACLIAGFGAGNEGLHTTYEQGGFQAVKEQILDSKSGVPMTQDVYNQTVNG